jgi:hypothetical protein
MKSLIVTGIIVSAGLFLAVHVEQKLSNPTDVPTVASTSHHWIPSNPGTDTSGLTPVATEFGSAHRVHVGRLPRNLQSLSKSLGSGNTLAAGDAGVSANMISQIGGIIVQDALPVLQNQLGAIPQSTHIVLFSKQKSYAQALLQAGVPPNQVTQMVKETGGITVNSDVWIPLYASSDGTDLSNVLTHELTHAVLNQQGIGDALPTWINEGTAWNDGLTAEAGLDASRVSELEQSSNQQMKSAPNLLPLTATEQDILNASYNVEWEDYLAVHRLISQYGAQKYESFLHQVKANGVEASFQSTFGTSLQTYEAQFYQSLEKGQVNTP